MNKNIVESLYDHIMIAREEAIKQGIETNTIVINENLARTEGLYVGENVGQFGNVHMLPPMIFGLRVKYSKNLPNDANFILTKSALSLDEQRIEMMKEFGLQCGIDVLTLFKAMKNGIYVKHWMDDEIFFIKPEQLALGQTGFVVHYVDSFDEQVLYFVPYHEIGEHWALTEDGFYLSEEGSNYDEED